MTTPAAATNTPALPGSYHGWLLLALLCTPALTLGAGARAEDACHVEFRVGSSVWYAVETQSRVSRTFASGCTAAAGGHPDVSFFMRGAREVIACDLELPLPDTMKAELLAAQLQGATALPSRRRTLEASWTELVRRYSPDLRCASGFQRMSDTTSGVPSVWCRRQLSASELCPAGSTFTEGACYTTACPDGTVDLERSTGGKLAGCSRCPAGRLDLEESVAWQDQSSSSSLQGPVTAILCKARATDPCPDLRGSVPSPARAAGRMGRTGANLPAAGRPGGAAR